MARQRDTLGTGSRTHFIANLGQWDAPFLYKAQMNNAALFAESNCLTIALRKSPRTMKRGISTMP